MRSSVLEFASGCNPGAKQRLSAAFRRLFLGSVLLFSPGALHAGDMDTHLTATYLLARKAGFTHEQAKTIAVGDWSMDLNSNTTAMPVVELGDPGYDRMKGKQWHPMRYPERGAAYHALGDKSDVRVALSNIRDGVNSRTGLDRNTLIGLGQYLHALQDVSFHQHGGEPYGKESGHALDGHETDMVAAHFDAALVAYSRSYDVLKAYKASGKVLAVPPVAELYYRDPTGLQLSRQQLKQIESQDRETGVVRIASKLALAYDKKTVHGMTELGEPTGAVMPDKVVLSFPSQQKLHAVTAELWRSLEPGKRLPDIPVMLDKRDRAKVDTDRSPNLLIAGPSKPLELKSLEELPALGSMPGGISLSVAAAARLPIRIRFDAVRIGKDGLVLVGASENAMHFDAAMLLTVTRLACEADDSYFSLDPDNGRLWQIESDQAFAKAWTALQPEIERSLPRLSPGDIESARNGVVLAGPRLLTMSIHEKMPELWRSLIAKYPHLRSRLVFRPQWLAHTRVGRALFLADVLLKELAGGAAAVTPGHRLRAAGIEGYFSADARAAAERLISTLEVTPAGGKEADHGQSGNRLWFDLVPEFRRQPLDDFPLPDMPPLDFPEMKNLSFAGNRPEAAPDETSRTEILRQVRSELQHIGVASTRVEATAKPVEVIQDGNALDLSEVYPHMFVRRHDFATGQDLPGTSPDLDTLAADVNGRVGIYANAHDELQTLTQIFRAFVIAVKWTQTNPAICETVQVLPMLTSERVGAALPRHHPSELFVSVAAVETAYPSGEDRIERWSVEGTAGSIEGGVSLGTKALLGNSGSFGQRATALTRSLHSAGADGIAPRDPGTVLAIAADSPQMLRALASLRAFKPVTMEDVFGGRAAPAEVAWNVGLRRMLIPVFGNPWLGLGVSAILLIIALMSFGALMAAITSMGHRLRKMRGKG